MPSIRCPGCSSAQSDTASVCERCGASLTEIVVGYTGRDELANDRESLENDGWLIVGITDGDGPRPLTVRYQRGALAAKRREVLPHRPQPEQTNASRFALAGVGVLLIAAAVAGGVLRWATGTHPAAAVTPSAVIVSIGGAPGVAFNGTITGVSSVNIAGAVPQTYRVDAAQDYAIVVQKQGEALSLLTVTLACTNGARFSSSTSVGHGIVSLSGSCEASR